MPMLMPIKVKDFPPINEQFMLSQTVSSLNVIPTFTISLSIRRKLLTAALFSFVCMFDVQTGLSNIATDSHNSIF